MTAEHHPGRTPIARAIGWMKPGLPVIAALISGCPASAQTPLPTDVMQTCTVTTTEFARWFVGANPVKDGIVLPANSLTFGGASDCAFYKWSAQMFLWLTSPLGPGQHVFTSPEFFGVAPPANGKRQLIPQDNNTLVNFMAAISLVGEDGQDVVADSTGKIHNVVRAQSGAESLRFRDAAGSPVNVARIAAAASGKPLLLDHTNKVIDVQTAANGAPELRDPAGKTITLADTTVVVNGVQRLVTSSGDVVELGQAGGGAVLMTRDNSLVYYLLQVNDVFAYFNTGMMDNKFAQPVPTQFPIEASLLDKITDIAKNAPPPHTRPAFQDRIALAMELKSSWVDAATLRNPQDYLTIKATVPNYLPSPTDPNKLTPQGSKNVDLALVGWHVVGSTKDHPEMIWATYEHINNTPNQKYNYKTTAGSTGTILADGVGSWLFSSSAAGTVPPPRMSVDGDGDIVAAQNQTIGPVDVTRQNAWGTPDADPAAVDNNTNVISLNRSILGHMPAGDIRSKYILIGSTWTKDGKAPTAGNVVGTTKLANSTMETFRQSLNCLNCHSGNMLGTPAGGGLSHIWGQISPLFP